MSDIPDLVEQVAGLTDATTDLLDATNVSKQTLDEAVDSATGSAGSASTDADTATTAKNEAVQARNESVQAKDDAVAVVYEGDATLTPTPGSIPIADSNARIDIGWLPFGEVNNPYSGVIGSVDKDRVFLTFQTETFANKLRILTNAFNINGRFVSLVNYDVTLAEAEDTADRAIAFDDVFLDWNGNIDTYRSITPHRTSTGYDADQIADEHGYSKVSNGLYKTGDSYALLLCRVARRNKGAYHPLWNPEGICAIYEKALGTPYYKAWYSELTRDIDNTEDCFAVGDSSSESARIGENWGRINSSSTLKTRPDSKPYDAIYADDVTPLYFSAANVTDRQALLFDSFNKAVAGETFSGAESTPFLTPVALNVPWEVFGTDRELKITILDHWVDDSIYKPLYPEDDRLLCQQLYYSDFTGYVASDSRAIYAHVITEFDGKHHWCRVATSAGGVDYINFYDRSGRRVTLVPGYESNKSSIISFYAGIDNQGVTRNPSPRPQFLACDIIGSLDAMPQEWLDNGIPGNWLAVGEEGEDLIPDGTAKHYKLSRKCLECYLVLKSTDAGVTWVTETGIWKTGFESSANGRTSVGVNETDCMMVFYRTAANPFELTDIKTFYALGDGFATSCNQSTESSAVFCSNMINKICTSSDYTYESFPLAKYSRNPASSDLSVSQPAIHDPLTRLSTQIPAAKALPQLVKLADQYSLLCIYKEVRHLDGDSGDDDIFQLVNNQTTITDLNGEEVIVGQKCLKTQFQFYGVTL